MEEQGRDRTTINDKQLDLLMIAGLLIITVLFLMSVDFLYQTGQYLILGITTVFFIGIILAIRMFKLKSEKIEI